MKNAAVLARHRRLLALCGLSLLLHALVIEWLAVRTRPVALAAPTATAMAIRLARPALAATPARAHSVRTLPDPPPARPGASAPAPPLPAPVPHTPAAAAAPAAVAASVGTPVMAESPAPSAEAPVQMPGRYRVRMPPSAVLTYALVRAASGQAAQSTDAAQIVWQTDGDSYSMRTDGVPGRLTSEGRSGDTGIEPVAASEQRADGSVATTRFDAAGQHIVFSVAARSYPTHPGNQDRASVLMQLAGIGLAGPGQVNAVIEIYVGGADEAAVARYQVLGQEEVETGLGKLAAWRLRQLAGPGQRRLEVWLAPAHSWYPVQLRATEADGTVSTQVLTGIESAASR